MARAEDWSFQSLSHNPPSNIGPINPAGSPRRWNRKERDARQTAGSIFPFQGQSTSPVLLALLNPALKDEATSPIPASAPWGPIISAEPLNGKRGPRPEGPFFGAVRRFLNGTRCSIQPNTLSISNFSFPMNVALLLSCCRFDVCYQRLSLFALLLYEHLSCARGRSHVELVINCRLGSTIPGI